MSMSLSLNIRGIQYSLAGIVLSLTHKHITIARQVMELRMQHVCAVAPAEMSCRVGNCHKDRVTPDFVPDEKAIAIGTAVGRGAEVHVEGVVKLIREARVSRNTTFTQLAGLAARNLHAGFDRSQDLQICRSPIA